MHSKSRRVSDLALDFISNFQYKSDAEDFIISAVNFLCELSGARFALCGRMVTDNDIQTIAVSDSGTTQENFNYSLYGTPCSVAVDNDVCIIPSNVVEKFPKDLMLSDMSAESYCGVRLRAKDGTPMGILAILDTKPIQDDQSISDLLSIFVGPLSREIEIRQKTSTILYEQERFRDFAEAASDWLWETDCDHRFTYLSNKIMEVTGFEEKDIIGKRRLDLIDAGTGKSRSVDEHLDILAKHKPFKDFQYRVYVPGQTPQYFLTSGKPIFNHIGEFQGYRGAARNITERIEREKALADSQQRFFDFASVASDWFWEQNEKFQFTYVSPSNQQISDLSPEDHYGKTRREILCEDEIEEVSLQAHERHIAQHKPFRDFHFKRKHKDGSFRYLSISGVPVYDSDNNFVGYRGTGRDITELTLTQNLLREEKARAEEADREKTAFLANMSHELRTPLNAIIGFSQLIASGGMPAEKNAQYAEDIYTSGVKLLSLVDDLLDVTAIESGKLELHRQLVSVGEVIEQCLLELEMRASSKSLNITKGYADKETILVHADKRALSQIFTNLLTNAVKFTEPGGSIHIELEGGKDGLKGSIYNTGPAIDASRLETIFNTFTKGTIEPYLTQEGSGLGLAIVKKLIDGHGGDVSISSHTGDGTTVSFRIPNEP
ncbi:MAG: PAS domain-containing sensor histidine kinase [Gimesia sp.]|nr:PAS domain-containing sensor histidine kinase [Gimesia sp.]